MITQAGCLQYSRSKAKSLFTAIRIYSSNGYTLQKTKLDIWDPAYSQLSRITGSKLSFGNSNGGNRPGMFITGEIPRKNKFEKGDANMIACLANGGTDPT